MALQLETPRDFAGVDPSDAWFDAAHGNGSYSIRNGELHISGDNPRMYVYDPRVERQWGNVEITMYFKRINDSDIDYAGMEAVARTNHLDDRGGGQCDTRGVAARVRNDGHVDFEKETAHPQSESVRDRTEYPDGLPENRWIGYKFLVYDESDGVHLELWLDSSEGRDGGEWRLVNSLIDTGAVFGKVRCSPSIDARIALTSAAGREGSESGKPNLCVYFRSDGVDRDGLVYRWGSIREIQS